MKLIVQRVSSAKVKSKNIKNTIEKGIVCLIGIGRNDTQEDIEYCTRKLVNCRIFEDENGKSWMNSVKSSNLELLLISQFTLFGYLSGNKLDFHLAMEPKRAKEMYNQFCTLVRKETPNVKEGEFGALMEVSLVRLSK